MGGMPLGTRGLVGNLLNVKRAVLSLGEAAS